MTVTQFQQTQSSSGERGPRFEDSPCLKATTSLSADEGPPRKAARDRSVTFSLAESARVWNEKRRTLREAAGESCLSRQLRTLSTSHTRRVKSISSGARIARSCMRRLLQSDLTLRRTCVREGGHVHADAACSMRRACRRHALHDRTASTDDVCMYCRALYSAEGGTCRSCLGSHSMGQLPQVSSA